MYCPRCGETQPLGTRRCTACGFPFTREEVATGRPSARSGAVGASGRYREWERGPGVGRRLLGCLALTVLAVVVVLGGLAVLSSAVVRPYIGRVIAERIRLPAAATGAIAGQPTRTAQPGTSALVPTVPAAPGRVVITQDELNAGIAAHPSQIRPLDSASVQITPTEVAVAMHAYGLSGTYHGQVTVQDGKAVLTNGRIDGPLGWLVPPAPVESAVNQQIAASLNASGVTVASVSLQDGQMTLDLAPR